MAIVTVADAGDEPDRDRPDEDGTKKRLPKDADEIAADETADLLETEVSPPPELGHIGKYLVGRYLGHGAMGRVYLGQHPDLQLQVAIKVIDKRHADDPRYRRQFLQEARLASQINHPNVIRIYDVDQDGDSCFMVQEYVDGGDVAALIRKTTPGGLPLRDALRIATGAAAGLAAAERLHIIHRDIKPSNILITRAGEPKLADLGLARKLRHATDTTTADGTITQPGSTVGTPAYMAPEQILTTGQVDIRADIYSLGATLFEMVTGQPPFPGTSTEDILRRHLHDPVRDPRVLTPKLPRRVALLIMRMLAKRPEDRPPSAAALLHDLERLSQPFPRRALLGWAAAVVLGLTLLGVVLTQRGIGHDQRFIAGMSLFSTGKYDQALPQFEAVRRLRPHNALLQYLLGLCQFNLGHLSEAQAARAELAASKGGADLGLLLEGAISLHRGDSSKPDPRLGTMEMVCNLAATAAAQMAESDDWTSRAAILAFPRLEDSGQPPTVQAAATAWVDGLEASMVQRDLFPVVDRSALDFILRELLLSQTGLVTKEIELRLGRLIPASVLVKSSFSGPAGLTLNLRLTDLESSRIFGVIERDPLDPGQRQATVSSLADDLVRCLAQRGPAQGVVAGVTGDSADLNIGRCHGLVVGQDLTVYTRHRSFFSRATKREKVVARARVTRLEQFRATVSLHDAREPVTPGMLVQAPAL
jgi:tRNA A-37 threonylcarbamoyl transferase component Bud32